MRVVKTKNKKAPSAKFVQLMSTPSPAGTDATWLLALDADGQVWIYLGALKGWKPMNMRRWNIAEVKADDKAFRAQHWNQRQRNDWDNTDDLAWP